MTTCPGKSGEYADSFRLPFQSQQEIGTSFSLLFYNCACFKMLCRVPGAGGEHHCPIGSAMTSHKR